MQGVGSNEPATRTLHSASHPRNVEHGWRRVNAGDDCISAFSEGDCNVAGAAAEIENASSPPDIELRDYGVHERGVHFREIRFGVGADAIGRIHDLGFGSALHNGGV